MLKLFNRKQKDPKQELRALLGNYELQKLPAGVMTVLSMLRDPLSETNDIANQIQMDLGMSVKILRLINSAAYGLTTKVSNVQHAVTILGRSRLGSMLLTYAMATTIPPTLECMDVNCFWLGAAAVQPIICALLQICRG